MTETIRKAEKLLKNFNAINDLLDRCMSIRKSMDILKISQDELASYIGTTQANVSRILTLNKTKINSIVVKLIEENSNEVSIAVDLHLYVTRKHSQLSHIEDQIKRLVIDRIEQAFEKSEDFIKKTHAKISLEKD